MSNFLDDVFAECPQCGHKDFAGPAEFEADGILTAGSMLTCTQCGRLMNLEEALTAGIEKALVHELTKDGTFKR